MSRSISPSSAISAQGKGEASSRPAAMRALRRPTVSPRALGDGDGQFGDLALGGVEPDFFAAPLLQQAVAVAQRLFHGRDPRAMIRIDRQHETVEKAPPVACGPREQAVHGGGEPDDAQVIGKDARRGNRFAIQPISALGDAFGHFQPGPQLQRAARLALDFKRHREAAGTVFARHFLEVGAAQAPAGGEERQGFEQIGLARAIVAGERDETPRRAQVERGIGAEIGQRDAPDERRMVVAGGGHAGVLAAAVRRDNRRARVSAALLRRNWPDRARRGKLPCARAIRRRAWRTMPCRDCGP